MSGAASSCFLVSGQVGNVWGGSCSRTKSGKFVYFRALDIEDSQQV